jgi:acyl-CoA thioester hydrolase
MDLDAYGHMGNARYYDLMTDARIAAFSAEEIMTDLSKQYVVVESGCTFKKPLFYPGQISIKVYCSKIGNSSFTLCYEFFMANEPSICCAEGHTVMVCYDASSKKTVSLPDLVRHLLGTE